MYKFTDKELEVKNTEIDLRHESDILTKEFGIDVLYVRNSRFVRCTCFDDLHKIGNPDCPLCFGSGYFSSVQKIKAISSQYRAYSYDGSLMTTPIGTTEQSNEVYYIQHLYTPKESDFLIKVTWDKEGYPVDVLKVMEIINIYEMRGDNGRSELNGCLISDRTDLVIPFRKALSVLPKKATSHLLKGGKSIWPNVMLRNSTKKDPT